MQIDAPEADVPLVDAPGEPADSEQQGVPVAAQASESGAEPRFPVETTVFSGELEELVRLSHRGEIDLSGVNVGTITAAYRRKIEAASRAGDELDLREISEFITLASRLIAEKAKVALPDDQVELVETLELDPATEAGRRLAEYRLFRAAADALLSGPVEDGARNFLSLVVPDVVPVERLRIPPERLAAAFRAVLQRFPEAEAIPVGIATFSVADVADRLRDRLATKRTLDFSAVFDDAGTRLEAVAFFLALLELLRHGEVDVTQEGTLDQITVTLRDGQTE